MVAGLSVVRNDLNWMMEIMLTSQQWLPVELLNIGLAAAVFFACLVHSLWKAVFDELKPGLLAPHGRPSMGWCGDCCADRGHGYIQLAAGPWLAACRRWRVCNGVARGHGLLPPILRA